MCLPNEKVNHFHNVIGLARFRHKNDIVRGPLLSCFTIINAV